MTYTITHLQADGSTTKRTPWPVAKTARDAAHVVTRMTGYGASVADAHASIVTLDATLVPAVTFPYASDPSQGIEVRVAS